MSISFVKSEVYTRKKQQRRFPENIRAIKDRIYVGGIPKDVEERELGDLFSSFGVVTHAGIVPSSNIVWKLEIWLCYLPGRRICGSETGLWTRG